MLPLLLPLLSSAAGIFAPALGGTAGVVLADAAPALSALASGVNAGNVLSVAAKFVPLITNIVATVSPGSQVKAAGAVAAVTNVFNPNTVVWLQDALNLTGAGVEVDGQMGPQTLGAVEALAEKYLGIAAGSPAAGAVNSLVNWVVLELLPGLTPAAPLTQPKAS